MNNGPFWKKNLEVIEKKNPDFLKNLEKLKEDDIVEVDCFKALTGDFTATARNTKIGREVLLNSRSDPCQEARKLAKDIEIIDGEFRCVLGMGMGYLPLEIIKLGNLKTRKILILEASPKIFESALNYVDLRPLLESDKISILLGTNPFFKPILNENSIIIQMSGIKVTTYEPARELLPEIYSLFNHRLREEGLSLLSLFDTTRHLGKNMFENRMANFTELFKSANVGILKDSMPDMPAIIIGAGPSLSDAFPVLKKWEDNAFLITVDSALPALLANDIKPDMVAMVDFSEACLEKIRDILDKIKDIPVCYVSSIYPLAIKMYPCDIKFFIEIEECFLHEMKEFWGNIWAPMPSMHSVAHLAYTVAALSGASPLILTGFDLAYTNFLSHVKGMTVPVNIDLEQSNWVEGLDGKMLPTMTQMLGDKALLEMIIELFGKPCYNANKKGAKIKGANECDFEELLSSISKPPKSSKTIISEKFKSSVFPRHENIISYLSKKRTEIKKAFNKSQDGYKKSKIAAKKLKNNFNTSDPKIIKLIKEALDDYEESYKLINDIGAGKEISQLIAGIEMDLKIEEFKIELDKKDDSTASKAYSEILIMNRSHESRINALKKIKDIFFSLEKRLSDEKNILNKLLNCKEQDKSNLLCQLGEVYLDYGDVLKAENILYESLKLKEKNPKAIFLLGIIMSKQNKHREAVNLLNQAKDLDPKLDVETILVNEKVWIEQALNKANIQIENLTGGFNLTPWGIRLLKEILRSYPENERAKSMLLYAEEKTVNYQKELSNFALLLEGDEKDSLKKLDELYENGEQKMAFRLAIILCKKYPSNVIVKEKLALLMFHVENKKKEGMELMTQAISLDPLRLDSKIHLAVMLAQEGDLIEAKSYFKEALKLDPKGLIALHETLGDIYYEIMQYDEAIGHYEQFFLANSTNKNSHEILWKMGNCYEKMGKIEAAKAAWEASKKIK